MTRFAWLAVPFVTLTACEEGVKRPDVPPADAATVAAAGQNWLCGFEYVNHAWGYQRRGAVLDTKGHIWTYDFRSSPTALVNPWGPKDLANMSEEELKLRYNGAADTGQKVTAEEIERHLPLIAEAAKGGATEPKNVGADMGAFTRYCFTYDAASGRYSQVMLDQKGDWETTNPSEAAKTLNAWLTPIVG
jgi:hypothetical protein